MYPLTMVDDTASDEEVFIPTRRRKDIKSGKWRTSDMQVLKRITWPHDEVVYDNAGEPAVYEEMHPVLFGNRYLMVMERESEPVKIIMLAHLQELMEDLEVYGWEVVRAYHAS